MNHGFTSKLAKDLGGFIDYKRAMGYAYEKAVVSHLRFFDQYCLERGHAALTKEVAEGWMALLVERSAPTSTLSQVSTIREFGKYLYSRGVREVFILPSSYSYRPRTTMPYLLTSKEIEAFFYACTNYKSIHNGYVRKILYTGIFQTMHCCGIRCCEVSKLTCKDVDFEAATIDIIDSKGPKSRRLYIGRQLADLLHGYDGDIAQVFPDRQAFFPSLGGGMLKNHTIVRGFNYLWDKAGLLRPESGIKPNPYAFRHHFACANIARWAKEGRDVMSMMPYLARYMGHANIQSSFYYIHLSPDIIADIPLSTRSLEALLPEVMADE